MGRIHIRRRLHILELRQHLSLLYPIAFLDVKLGDFAKSIRADIHISLRLDLARCAHHRNQIHALRLARLHRDHILVALINGETHDGGQQHDRSGTNRNFFPGAHKRAHTLSAF